MSTNCTLRYWYHPESDDLWASTEDEKAKPGSALVEELDKEQYERIKAQQDATGDSDEA